MLFRSLFGFVLLSLAVCGCNPGGGGASLVETIGTVTYNGKPLQGASVAMLGEKGELANGTTDAAGKFKMTTGGRPGVAVGKMKVGITKAAAVVADTKALTAEDMRKMQMAGGGKAADLTPKSEIPMKYADPNNSGLQATIDADPKKNVFEYPLVD